ncbi:MAG: hypothetical protein ACFNLD_11840 [Kingella oralis]
MPSGALNGLCAGCDVGKPLMFRFEFQAAYVYLLPAQAFRQPEISVTLKTNGVLAARRHCSNP